MVILFQPKNFGTNFSLQCQKYMLRFSVSYERPASVVIWNIKLEELILLIHHHSVSLN